VGQCHKGVAVGWKGTKSGRESDVSNRCILYLTEVEHEAPNYRFEPRCYIHVFSRNEREVRDARGRAHLADVANVAHGCATTFMADWSWRFAHQDPVVTKLDTLLVTHICIAIGPTVSR
jgi:hypothetical protein